MVRKLIRVTRRITATRLCLHFSDDLMLILTRMICLLVLQQNLANSWICLDSGFYFCTGVFTRKNWDGNPPHLLFLKRRFSSLKLTRFIWAQEAGDPHGCLLAKTLQKCVSWDFTKLQNCRIVSFLGKLRLKSGFLFAHLNQENASLGVLFVLCSWDSHSSSNRIRFSSHPQYTSVEKMFWPFSQFISKQHIPQTETFAETAVLHLCCPLVSSEMDCDICEHKRNQATCPMTPNDCVSGARIEPRWTPEPSFIKRRLHFCVRFFAVFCRQSIRCRFAPGERRTMLICLE